jgi:hypothetical protein
VAHIEPLHQTGPLISILRCGHSRTVFPSQIGNPTTKIPSNPQKADYP